MFEEEDEDFYQDDFTAELEAFNTMYKANEFRYIDSDKLEVVIDHLMMSSVYSKARWGVEMALVHYPFNTTFKLRKAQILSATGELKEALEILNEIEKLEGLSLEIILTKAGCFNQLRDSKSAIKYFKLALDYSAKDERDEIYLDLALEYQNISDYKSAIAVLNEATKQNPKNEVAVYELAFCHDQIGDYENAISCFTQYIDENPYSFTAWYNLANAYLKVENYEKAIWAYDYSILINDDFPPALFNLGNAYLSSGKVRKALECFEKCLELEGEDGLILSYMGECYEELGELELALNCYKRSSTVAPHLGDAWLGMGIVKDLQGHTTEAMKLVEKAIELTPDNASYYHVLAGIYEKFPDIEKTIEAYRKGCEMDPTNEEMVLDYFKVILEFNPNLVEELWEVSPDFQQHEELEVVRIYALWLSQKKTDAFLLLDKLVLIDVDLAKKLFLYFPETKNITDFTHRILD